MAKIFYTDENFQPGDTNPFNNDEPYDQSWVFFKLVGGDAGFYAFTGKGRGRVFQVIISKKDLNWKYHIMDFIEYESRQNKNIIIAVSKEDLVSGREEYKGHHFMDPFLRPYEKEVLVHSTTWEGWQSILSKGALMSWSILAAEGTIKENAPIGEALGDPCDYRDYIMFGYGGVMGEIVVASKQKGYIEMSSDKPYKPGARLYFNAKKIAKDGLLVRDGVHLKVADKLPLEDYLIWAATAKEVGLDPDETTPRRFAEESDRLFQEKFGYRLE